MCFIRWNSIKIRGVLWQNIWCFSRSYVGMLYFIVWLPHVLVSLRNTVLHLSLYQCVPS